MRENWRFLSIMDRRLIEFWILDSMAIEPVKFIWDHGKLASPIQKIDPGFDPSIVISELIRLRANGHIVGRIDIPFSVEQWEAGVIVADVRLCSSGGRRWEKLAEPNWEQYVSTSYNQRQRVCIRSTSKERIVLEAYRFFRFNSMSEIKALRFRLDCESRIQQVRCKMVYWQQKLNAFKLYVPTSQIITLDGADSIKSHLDWVQSVVDSEKWYLFGFGNRYASNLLLGPDGSPNMDVIRTWEIAQKK